MINKEMLHFFTLIQQNNKKPWFEKNKQRCLALQDAFLNFVGHLLTEIRKIDTIYEKNLKRSTRRIYKDIRFSKYRNPYKNHISGLLESAPGNKKCPLYIHIQPGNSFIGCGAWQQEPALLQKVREEIDYNGSAFNKIIKLFGTLNGDPLFDRITRDKLIRPPKGYIR